MILAVFLLESGLESSLRLMIDRGYNDEVQFSCNMRFGALTRDDYRLMKKAGFQNASFRRGIR